MRAVLYLLPCSTAPCNVEVRDLRTRSVLVLIRVPFGLLVFSFMCFHFFQKTNKSENPASLRVYMLTTRSPLLPAVLQLSRLFLSTRSIRTVQQRTDRASSRLKRSNNNNKATGVDSSSSPSSSQQSSSTSTGIKGFTNKIKQAWNQAVEEAKTIEAEELAQRDKKSKSLPSERMKSSAVEVHSAIEVHSENKISHDGEKNDTEEADFAEVSLCGLDPYVAFKVCSSTFKLLMPEIAVFPYAHLQAFYRKNLVCTSFGADALLYFYSLLLLTQ